MSSVNIDNYSNSIYDEIKCLECRKQRDIKFTNARKKERNKWGKNIECPFFCFFGEGEHITTPLDIFLILMGHAGNHSWKNIIDVADQNSAMKSYYVELKPYGRDEKLSKGKYETFHQKEIHLLLNELSGRNWLLTDFIKCSTENTPKKNIDIALEYCSKYLISQINDLKPKTVVLFGVSTVQKWFDKYIKNELEYSPQLLKPAFPSQWTADKWVRNGGINSVLDELEEIKNG